MPLRYLPLLLVSALCVSRYIKGDVTSDLHALYQEFYAWRLEDSPEFATYVGTYRYNDRVQSFNYTRMEERYNVAESFKADLDRIKPAELCKRERLNYRIMKDSLEAFLQGFVWSRFGSLNPLNFLEGNQLDPIHQVEATPFFTRGDYENFIARLEDTPIQLQEYQELYRLAIDMNRTSHNVSVNRVPGQIERLLVSPENTPFFQPFKGPLDSLHLHDNAKRDLRHRAYTAIEEVLRAFQQLKIFLESEYFPNTRPTWGVGSLDHGLDYYKACLKWHLSTDMSPEEVHQIGLQEVDRIVGLMKEIPLGDIACSHNLEFHLYADDTQLCFGFKLLQFPSCDIIMVSQNFNGSIAEYFRMLRNVSSLHMNSEEALLEGYRRLINDRIYPKLSLVFNNLPNLPVRVERMPFDGPGGQYISGSEDGSRAGIFMVNLNRPHEIGTYIMVPITLHESNPGHHLQASYAMKANLPDFRRNTEFSRYYEVPFHFPFYTAYVEGWALYAESLGEELNLYRDNFELMGRYSSEIFRACRLVVDTGLHYYGWDRESAIQYMLNYTSFSRAEMTTEVDRYITWPGQACAYKIGEIKIKQLRKKAEDQLGEVFDIREFHTVILENGPMPLSILQEIVDDWLHNYIPQSSEKTCSGAPSVLSSFFLLYFHIMSFCALVLRYHQ